MILPGDLAQASNKPQEKSQLPLLFLLYMSHGEQILDQMSNV